MGEFIAALAIFSLALLGMSLGVIFTGRKISGSCGGSDLCDFCDETTKQEQGCTRKTKSKVATVSQ